MLHAWTLQFKPVSPLTFCHSFSFLNLTPWTEVSWTRGGSSRSLIFTIACSDLWLIYGGTHCSDRFQRMCLNGCRHAVFHWSLGSVFIRAVADPFLTQGCKYQIIWMIMESFSRYYYLFVNVKCWVLKVTHSQRFRALWFLWCTKHAQNHRMHLKRNLLYNAEWHQISGKYLQSLH